MIGLDAPTDIAQKPSAFGRFLQELRVARGVSQEELAGRLEVPIETIVAWEFGKAVPDPSTIFQGLREKLRLPNSDVQQLLYLAGYAAPPPDEVPATYALSQSETPGILASVYDPRRMLIQEIYGPPAMREVSDSTGLSEFRTRLKDLESSVVAIRDELENAPLTETDSEDLSLVDHLQNLEQTISRVLESSQRIVAPVVLPPPKDLEVRLVAATSLVRLEEYRQEENKWFAVTGIFLGGILGVFVNWVTGGVMSAAAWVLVAAFAVMGGVAGYSTREYRKRAAPLWKRVLGEGSQEPEDEAHSEKRDRTSSEAGEP